MKDPTRLLNAAASDSELRILRAGMTEEPPAEALERLAARLSVKISSVPVGSAVSATQNAAMQPASSLQAGGAASAAGMKLIASPIVLAAVSLTLAGALWFATRPAQPQPTAAPSTVEPSDAPPPDARRSSAEPSNVAPIVPPPTAEHPSSASSTPSDSTSPRALADEIARLDVVRGLLASNRAKPALAALRSYERKHPQGALRQEGTLLRIEALQRAGDRARARALAERFLADNPNSPHAPRVRALGLDAADAD